MGYKVALRRDPSSPVECDMLADFPYEGYVHASNKLVHMALDADSSCDWVVCGGDDYWPVPDKRADEIADDCAIHFSLATTMQFKHESPTFGVMQPTGDRWGDSVRSREQYGENRGAYLDRIAGSPWIGRDFAKRIYGGKGPMWPEFYHMYADEHLQCVAEKLGVYWQRRDLVQYHDHWGRSEGGLASRKNMPDFLQSVNTSAHFAKEKAIFDRLKKGGFAEANG